MDTNNSHEQEALLVFDKEEKNLSAVKEITDNGFQKVPINRGYSGDMLKVDKNSNMLENFIKNFANQYDNPKRFGFTRVSVNFLESLIKIQEKHEQKPFYINPTSINFADFTELGINPSMLDENTLETMLKGGKSPKLLPINATTNEKYSVGCDAKLSFRKKDTGEITIRGHGIRDTPNFNKEYFKHKFSQEDIDSLKETGNMGRVVNLEKYRNGNLETVPSFISIDKLTNDIVDMPVSQLRYPPNILFDDDEKKIIAQGGKVQKELFSERTQKPYPAIFQVSAVKRGLDMTFPQKTQRRTIIPDTLATVKLTDKDQLRMYKGEAVYKEGFKPKGGGEPYNGYAYLNEKGEIKISSKDPKQKNTNSVKDTVNSENKTSETKNEQSSKRENKKTNTPKLS